MGLPSKNRRNIVVGGKTYVWIASGNDGYLDLIISFSNGQGQKLCAQFSYEAFNQPIDMLVSRQISITPSIVKQVIIHGLQLGWTPEKTGKDIWLRFMD